MTQSNLASARVLVVGAKGYAGPVLRTVLTAAGITRIVLIDEPRRALDLLCTEHFEAVFMEGRPGSMTCPSRWRRGAARCCSIP